MENFEKKLKEYAELLIRVGLHIEKGMELMIYAPVDTALFARMCVSAAYDAGAKEVTVIWSDDYVTRERFLRAESEVFENVPTWRQTLMNGKAREGVPHLFIEAADPMNLKDADPARMLANAKARGRDLEEFQRLETTSFFPWCIASVPIKAWADKVFPDQADNVDLLWDAIFEAVRVKGDGTAVAAWETHLENLRARTEKLNAYNFVSLHYQNALGTDLTVQLPENHIWMSGEEKTPTGHPFVANMPTEEIFTAPLKTGVNGVVHAAMPLVEDGNLIRDFYFVFKDGKIVEMQAKEGEEVLRNSTLVDEGASFLGEVALIPFNSPISNQKILYYETLFDENASCHLAYGAAYPCITGGGDMSDEELKTHGLNVSSQHTDFMIGTSDLSIVGTTHSGEKIEVFKDGNFCF